MIINNELNKQSSKYKIEILWGITKINNFALNTLWAEIHILKSILQELAVLLALISKKTLFPLCTFSSDKNSEFFKNCFLSWRNVEKSSRISKT